MRVTIPFKVHRSSVPWRTNTCQPSSQHGSDRLGTDVEIAVVLRLAIFVLHLQVIMLFEVLTVMVAIYDNNDD